MRETISTAMPPCFDRWCKRFDDIFKTKAQRKEFPSTGFSLIIDDSGHRKSGNFTDGVGRQYIGEIGKTDNGIVVVTSHLYDGVKSLPLDIELYQHASSLPEGKKDHRVPKKAGDSFKLNRQNFKEKVSTRNCYC
jgi:SRSO17 transposase